jgi:hypothetical protein
MSLTTLKPLSTVLLAAGLLMTGASWRVAMAQPPTQKARLNADTFQAIHRKIRPQPGESFWMAIPWLTDLHDARQKAANEGKPLFLMVSGKGLSIGMC